MIKFDSIAIMDKILSSHESWLRYLTVARASQRNQLLRCISNDQITIISELCLNLLHGNIRLSESDFNLLNRHRNTYRRLAQKSGNVIKREWISKSVIGIKQLVGVFLKDYDRMVSSRGGYTSSSSSTSSCSDSDSENDNQGLSEVSISPVRAIREFSCEPSGSATTTTTTTTGTHVHTVADDDNSISSKSSSSTESASAKTGWINSYPTNTAWYSTAVVVHGKQQQQ